MQINSDTKQILGLSESPYQPVAQGPKHKASVQADGIESGVWRYLEKSRTISADDAFDVERVCKELESGQFDKPEMIRAAAEKLIQFGI
ncbi:MAG: hypothetical protein JXB18_12935 [Sedimentisphaerales bacterium]|nr:hypothetical protein [Sedimentisphaerales bacterium]